MRKVPYDASRQTLSSLANLWQRTKAGNGLLEVRGLLKDLPVFIIDFCDPHGMGYAPLQ